MWAAWERVANLFSFWVEHHALKKLEFPTSVFIDEAEIFRAALEEWEAANPETRWREFPAVVVPDLENPDVLHLATIVFTTTGVQVPRESVWHLLQKHPVATIEKTFRHFISFHSAGIARSSGSPTRDAKLDVKKFFVEDSVPLLLQQIKIKEAADAAALERQKAYAIEQDRVQAERAKKQEAERVAAKIAADERARAEELANQRANQRDERIGHVQDACQTAAQVKCAPVYSVIREAVVSGISDEDIVAAFVEHCRQQRILHRSENNFTFSDIDFWLQRKHRLQHSGEQHTTEERV
jgi:hypothetical protein